MMPQTNAQLSYYVKVRIALCGDITKRSDLLREVSNSWSISYQQTGEGSISKNRTSWTSPNPVLWAATTYLPLLPKPTLLFSWLCWKWAQHIMRRTNTLTQTPHHPTSSSNLSSSALVLSHVWWLLHHRWFCGDPTGTPSPIPQLTARVTCCIV